MKKVRNIRWHTLLIDTDGYLFMILFVCVEHFRGTLALRAKIWVCLD